MDSGRGPGDRSCFVHAGTHKTGTSSIQRFLFANRERLARAGLYYPATGLLSAEMPGHHNAAFELTGDPRFERTGGRLVEILGELARSAPPNACLSSEGFQHLHVNDGALVSLRDAIGALGYRPRIVLYVRAQDEYLESLFAELVKHGMLCSFANMLETVMRDGLVRHDRVWAFRFDYSKLAGGFASVFGADAVIVRAYRNDGRAESIMRDFLGAAGVAQAVPYDVPAAYENFRFTTGAVITWLFRHTAAALGDERLAAAGAELVARFPREASAPFRPLSPRDRARVAMRFAADNARLALHWPAAASLAQPRPAELETEDARAARALFERAEAVRARSLAHASPVRSGAASGG